jgi:hypothetical protein
MAERDLIKKRTYIEEHNVLVTGSYRLNFIESRSCGIISVYKGKEITEESFEVYSELLECGLDEKSFIDRYEKVQSEIKEGKIDVNF